MSVEFTAAEVAYLHSQRLARIATVAPDGQPDVVPVTFVFNGSAFFIGGFDPARTRRWRNVLAGNARVALVVDDLATVDPWAPRFLRVYGTAELQERRDRLVMKVVPDRKWSMNLESGPQDPSHS